MKKILVLGSNGFLGSHFCRILSKNNFKIYPVVRHSSNLERFNKLNKKKKIKILKYRDLSNTKKIIKFIKKYKINLLINFAAHGVLYKKKQKKFKIFNKTNFLDVKKLLKNCLNIGLDRYIHIGSISECGRQKKIFEGQKERAFDNYSLSKLNLSNYLKFNHNKKKLPYTLIRLCPTYGPLENNKKLFPYLINNLKRNSLVKLTSCKQIRSYTYVDDIIHGIIKSIRSKKTINQSLILGNNQGDKLKNIVKKVTNILKKNNNLIIWNKFKRKDESINYISNCTKTNKLINWRPSTSLKSGVKKMLKYY